MDGFVILVAAFAALVLFATLAVRYGVDSRIDSNDPRRSPVAGRHRPLGLTRRRLAHLGERQAVDLGAVDPVTG